MTIIGDSVGNLQALDRALGEDVTHWFKEVETRKDDQIARRALVRSVFALIEGTVFGLKQVALQADIFEPRSLDTHDVTLIQEQLADLDDAGKVKTRPTSLRFRPNLKFAFKVFAKASGAAFALDASGPGYQALDRSTWVRDRIMHPKKPSDLLIQNSEIDDLRNAYVWFNQSLFDIFDAATKARDKQIADLAKTEALIEAERKKNREQLDQIWKKGDA